MKELAPRDLVARAIETEIQGDRDIMNPDYKIEHVWIDLRHLSDYLHEVEISEVTSFFKKFVNIDPKQELCPVRPSNHYQMGGIPTTEFGEVQNTRGRSSADCMPLANALRPVFTASTGWEPIPY